MEFSAWLTKKGEDEKTLIDLTQTIALINLLDKGESDFDGVQLSTPARRQGAGIQARVPGRHREGLLPHRESRTRSTRGKNGG